MNDEYTADDVSLPLTVLSLAVTRNTAIPTVPVSTARTSATFTGSSGKTSSVEKNAMRGC